MVKVSQSLNCLERARDHVGLILFLFSLVVMASSANAASLTASLDRSTTTVGESVTLSIVAEGGSLRGQPQVPQIPGVQFANPQLSQQFTSVNGQQQFTITLSWTLTPTKAGDVTIPVIQGNIDGKILSTQPLKLKVLAQAPAAPGQPEEAFLKLIVPKTDLYLGEVVPAELRLYFKTINNATLPQVQADGFVVGSIPAEPHQSQVQVNGVVYNLATFRFPLSAAKTGSLTFGPGTCNLTVLSNVRKNIIGQVISAQQREVSLTTETFKINVLSLPQQTRPATFSGAIGAFNMNLTAGPTNLAVGDPITVRIEISGRGALDTLALPAQPAWREFKSYTPSGSVETQDPLHLEGTKKFEWIVSPQNADIHELPPFEFSFFDSDAKTYRTLRSPAIGINVRPTAATPMPTVVNAAPPVSPKEKVREIVHIQPQLGVVKRPAPPLIRQPWFLALQLGAPLLWMAALAYRRQSDHLENNPRLRRRREVERITGQGLRDLQRFATENKSDEFFETVFKLLQEQLGERLNLPASGITEAVLEEELKTGEELPPETMALLGELFATCNQARYAPVRSSQALAAIIPKLERALNDLRKVNHDKAPATA
jgi:hypothetical protein